MSRNDVKGQTEPQTLAGSDRENRANSSATFQPLGSHLSQPAGNFARRSNIWSAASLNQQASTSSQNSGAVDSNGAQHGDRSEQATSYTRPARQPFGGPSTQDLSVPRGSHTPWASHQTNVWASNDPSSPFNVASWRRPSAEKTQASSSSNPATIQTSSHERASTGWSQPQAGHSTLLASLPRLNTHSTVVDARPLGLPQRASANANSARGLPPGLSRQSSQPQFETQRTQLSASHVFQPFDHSLSLGLADPYAGRIGHASDTIPTVSSSNAAELGYDANRMRIAQLEQNLDVRGLRRTPLEYSPLAHQSNGVVPESRLLQNEACTSAGQTAWNDGRQMASQHGRFLGLMNGDEYTWSPMHQMQGFNQQMNQQGHQLHHNLHGLAIQGAPMPDDTTQASVRALGNGSTRDYLTGLPTYLPMNEQQQQLQARVQHFRERQALPQMSINGGLSSTSRQAHLRRLSPASEDTVTPLPGSQIGADCVAGASEAATLTTSLRSKALEAYKSNPKTNPRAGRPWEIKDIYDHVVEFAGDQNGSRFIQTRLESANSEEKERVFREIQPNAVQLTMDVFGNYVIQKLFEYGDQNQKSILVNQMRGQILSLSLQTYACRVVQTALRYVLVEQQAMMVRELERDVLRCVRDQNGNHVIQKAIECCRHSDITFVIASFIGQLHQLSIHQYGCRVVQRLLERCDDYWKSVLLQEIFTCAGTLITDPFGNYVAQNVIEQGGPQGKAHMFQLIKDNFEAYSKQKYSSNVVEHMLKFCSPEHHRELVLMMLRTDHGSEMPLSILLRDQYGNYVIQRTLNTISERDFYPFVDILAAEMAKWKKFMPAKNYEMVLKHMNRFPPRPSSRRSRVIVPLPPLQTSQPEPPSTPTPALTSSERGSTPRSSSIPSTIADESPSHVTAHKGGDDLGQEIEFTLSEH